MCLNFTDELCAAFKLDLFYLNYGETLISQSVCTTGITYQGEGLLFDTRYIAKHITKTVFLRRDFESR